MGNGEGRAQSKALFITVYPWEQLTRKGAVVLYFRVVKILTEWKE